MNKNDARSSTRQYGLTRELIVGGETFDSESTRVFAKSWIYVCRESELTSTNCKRISLDSNHLFLIKDEKGIVQCFRNFCRHRGSQLMTDDNCSSVSERIQCPYHAWTYGRNGQLIAAPNMQASPGFELDQNGLLAIQCECWHGFVFIRLHNSGPSLADFLQPLRNHALSWSFSDLMVAEEIHYDVAANWKLIFQNYSECYHCPVVHPALNRITPFTGSSNDLSVGPILGGPMQLSSESESMSVDGLAVAGILPHLDNSQRRSVAYYTIFPTLFLSPHPDYVLLHRLERINPRQTRVHCYFLFHSNSISAREFDPSPAVEFWDLTNRQDWEVCESAQRGIDDVGYIPGQYSKLESMVAEFDRYYCAQMLSDS